MNRREFIARVGIRPVAGTLAASALAAGAGSCGGGGGPRRKRVSPQARPNILFALSDDQSWLYTGAAGDPVVRTPVFDRVAREGVSFAHAYCTTPSCTPSRASILTGRMFWELEEGRNLHGCLPPKFPVFPDLLEVGGYHVGFTGKGWGPGDYAECGRGRNPAGPRYRSFREFLTSRPKDAPFCFWFGSHDPHRPYSAGSGGGGGSVAVPPFLPDVPEVQGDLREYLGEIERFDRELGAMLQILEEDEELDNTLVVVSSDNGMPFPRAKANLYDYGTRVPLAVRWHAQVDPGRTVSDFISLVDLAPTFLEGAGVRVPRGMTGRSFLNVLTSGKSGRVAGDRSRVFTGRERHTFCRAGGLGYPCRAVRTHRFLYIHNLTPDRWPAGDPEAYDDVDSSPTKDFILANRNAPAVRHLFGSAFGKRPEEELYDLTQDPHQMTNVAYKSQYTGTKSSLRLELEQYMTVTRDFRAGATPLV